MQLAIYYDGRKLCHSTPASAYNALSTEKSLLIRGASRVTHLPRPHRCPTTALHAAVALHASPPLLPPLAARPLHLQPARPSLYPPPGVAFALKSSFTLQNCRVVADPPSSLPVFASRMRADFLSYLWAMSWRPEGLPPPSSCPPLSSPSFRYQQNTSRRHGTSLSPL